MDRGILALYAAIEQAERYEDNPDMAERTGVNILPLTCNKDLAYLEGRVLAMWHLSNLHHRQDTDGVVRLFAGKYDPTNPAQAALLEKASILAI